MSQGPKQLTAQQVAERLDVTGETVRAWARNGRIRCIKYPSGRMRFREEDIAAIERGEYDPTTGPANAPAERGETPASAA